MLNKRIYREHPTYDSKEYGNDMIVFYIAKCDLSIIKGKAVDHTMEAVG